MASYSHDSKKPRRRGANSDRGFKPYHSVSVPKHVDLVHQVHEDRPKTTVMLRNIPNRYSQVTLLKEIDAQGFIDSYDFFYLPMDTKNRTNVGYDFINFLTAQDLERFMKRFAGYVFPHCPTPKAARVSLAHIQGFIENIRHFSNRAVSHSRNSQYRPIVIHKGNRMDITDAYDLLCKAQVAQVVQPVMPEMQLLPQPEIMQTPAYPQTEPPPGLDLPWQMPLAQPRVTMPPPTNPPRVAGDSFGESFEETRRGFEEAISMYLASCGSVPDVPPPISRFDYAGAAFPAQLPAFQPRLFHEEDDEQTDEEETTPRHGLPGIAKFGLADEAPEESVTPRTNKTLFVHGRFSA